jgi:hypothetical protein
MVNIDLIAHVLFANGITLILIGIGRLIANAIK